MSELCYFIVFCLDVVILCVHVFMLLTERFIRILHYHYTKFYIGQQFSKEGTAYTGPQQWCVSFDPIHATANILNN